MKARHQLKDCLYLENGGSLCLRCLMRIKTRALWLLHLYGKAKST